MRSGIIVGALAASVACTRIVPVPLSNAPVNHCACDGFDGAVVSCKTSSNRCEVSGRPPYAFFLVVQPPESSLYAPSATFAPYAEQQQGAPTFTRTQSSAGTGFTTKCTGPKCVELGAMAFVTNVYRVSASQSLRAGYPLADRQRIPATVEYELVANPTVPSVVQPDLADGLPIQALLVAPRLGPEGAETFATLPTGFYRRRLYPQPPFDALFPPRARTSGATSNDRLEVKPAKDNNSINSIIDEFVLTDDTLDRADTRSVTVRRNDGLEGWQVWVADRSTKRRISTLRTLSGTSQTLTLDTTGERRGANDGLGDDVEVVVSPPSDFVAVPRFINPVNGGDLGTINYPFLKPPVPVAGNVLEPETGDTPLGYAAQLAFESVNIETPGEASPTSPLLHYSTRVSTDARGVFATVLPPGTYDVTVEPALGTGFAKFHQVVQVKSELTSTAVKIVPPKRTLVHGRAVVADGRPMVEADILATPQTPTSADVPKPRPSQTRTDREGRYTLELDQGPYLITAIPKAGTGFPRGLIRSQILPGETELPDISVPAPVVVAFTLRDASRAENTVANALVRVFSVPPAAQTGESAVVVPEAIELAAAMSDDSGQVEILLAPSPP